MPFCHESRTTVLWMRRPDILTRTSDCQYRRMRSSDGDLEESGRDRELMSLSHQYRRKPEILGVSRLPMSQATLNFISNLIKFYRTVEVQRAEKEYEESTRIDARRLPRVHYCYGSILQPEKIVAQSGSLNSLVGCSDRTRNLLFLTPLEINKLRNPRFRCQETGDSNWLDLTSIDSQLRFVIRTWTLLNVEEKRLVIEGLLARGD